MPTKSESDSGAAVYTKYTKVAAAVSAVVAGQAMADTLTIEEIVVTANKLGEVSVQDLASSVQAFSGEDLRRQQLFSLEDYSRFVPSMSFLGNQSGGGKIFFRGVADAPDTFIAQSSAAIYLDEQPVTQNAQVDVRLIDVERVEALSGPQGSLFGSSSQSGTLRIVTNKPDPTKISAFVDLTGTAVNQGEESYDVSAMVNVPLVDDRLAIRLVGFDARQGGFIDNVLGATPSSENGGRTSINGQQFNDGTVGGVPVYKSVVEDDWNDTTIRGGRASARWFVNDAWTVSAGIAFQDADVDGENTYDDSVGDLKVVAFNKDTREDKWTQYSFTIEGDLGFADLTSATAYFTRDSRYIQDTTSYTAYFGGFCYYATAAYNIYCFQPAGVNYTYNDPIGFLDNDAKNTSFSQEIRLSHRGENFDWVAGVFWEDRHEEWDFATYTTNDGGYRASQGFANWDVAYWNVSPQATDAWWLSADDTDWTTTAVFGEATFRVGDRFSATVGGRWFDVDMEKTYWVELPLGRLTPALTDKHGCLASLAPCNPSDSTNPADDGFTHPTSNESDFALKVSAQYRFAEDAMVYGLFSQGFRAGGTNRNRGLPFFPAAYDADFLDNVELGVKSMWMDGRVMANLTAFSMSWDDYQLEVVDPSNIGCGNANAKPAPFCGQPWQKVITNVGSASIDGLEAQFRFIPAEGWDLGGNATWTNAEVDQDVPELSSVVEGADLPFAPKFKTALYAQYTMPMQFMGSDEAYARLQYSHVADSVNQVQQLVGGNTPQITQGSYEVADLKLGLESQSWEVNLFVKNMFDERGEVYHDNTDFEPFWGRNRTSVIRPREIGFRFVKHW